MKNKLVMPALTGGLLVGVASALPLVNLVNCLCCAWIIAGGFLAGYLYLRSEPPGSPATTYGDAVVLGLLTGVLGAVIWAAVETPLHFLDWRMPVTQVQLDEIERALREAELPPEVREWILGFMGSGRFSLAMMFFGFLVNLILSVCFCIVGAVLSFATLRKPTPPAPQPAAPSEVPPAPSVPPSPPGGNATT
ncbi:MAG: hypothetical protein Kow00109_24820 [Acidobacteriota bacterium]